MRRRVIAILLAGALGGGADLAAADAAHADIALPRVVGSDPVDHTPHVTNGTVWTATVVGDVVVVGGDFHAVTDSTGTHTYPRRNLFAYRLGTGEVLPWAPAADRAVYALAPGADHSVYVGGWFKTVNGARQRGLARLSLHDGRPVPGFSASVNWGDVRALEVRAGWLYVGGTFSMISGWDRAALARLDAATGAVDRNFNARIAAPGLRRARVEDLTVSPDGRRLVLTGAFRSVGGLPRHSIAMLHTSGPQAVVVDWYTGVYAPPCLHGFDTYVRAVDFSPAGDYFVVVTTGRATGPTLMCDSAARFPTHARGAQQPVWVNRTGGDSLYAVAVTGSAVYVGGHQRWMDNHYGKESAGPGAVPRKGIAALDPATGRALPWNPGKSRGVGTRALLATPAGLIVGSDTEKLGGERHARLGMFPLA